MISISVFWLEAWLRSISWEKFLFSRLFRKCFAFDYVAFIICYHVCFLTSLSFQFWFLKSQNKLNRAVIRSKTNEFILDNLRAQWHLYDYQTRSVWKKEHRRLSCRWLKEVKSQSQHFDNFFVVNIWFRRLRDFFRQSALFCLLFEFHARGSCSTSNFR